MFQDSEEIVTRQDNMVITYRPVGSLRNYSRSFKGYEPCGSSASSTSSPVAYTPVGNKVMDSMLQSGRQVITSTPPARYMYAPGDQVFDVCLKSQPKVWKDMPPVLQAEVNVSQEKSAEGTPAPTWSYRRETKPPLADDGPPKLHRMVPSPVTTMLREQEQAKGAEGAKSIFIPASQTQGPPSLQAPSPLVTNVTSITSAIHQSGGTVGPAAAVPVAGAPVVKPGQRVMHISKQDYMRLLAQNKIRIVQQAPGGKGQVIQLQAGLQIITQRPVLSPPGGGAAAAASATATATAGAVPGTSSSASSSTPRSVTVTASSPGSTVLSSPSPSPSVAGKQPFVTVPSSPSPSPSVAGKQPFVINPWSVTTESSAPPSALPLTGSASLAQATPASAPPVVAPVAQSPTGPVIVSQTTPRTVAQTASVSVPPVAAVTVVQAALASASEKTPVSTPPVAPVCFFQSAPVSMSPVTPVPLSQALPAVASSATPNPVSQAAPLSQTATSRTKESAKGSGDDLCDDKISQSARSVLTSRSHKQFAGYTSKCEQPAAGDRKSDGAKPTSAVTVIGSSVGLNGTHGDSPGQDRGSKPVRHRLAAEDDDDVPPAKVFRPAHDTLPDNSGDGAVKKSAKLKEQSDISDQTAMPKVNLKGLSSQLASAMAKKLEQSSAESSKLSASKRNHADSKPEGKTCSESSPEQDSPAPCLRHENMTTDAALPENPSESDDEADELMEESEMEVEDSGGCGPPLLEPVADSLSSRSGAGKGGLFESMGSSLSSSETDNSRSAEITSRVVVGSLGSRGSTSGSGSRNSKTPLKHADSNIFQRMLDFSSGSSPEKVLMNCKLIGLYD